ncbi:MAG: shikimate dehydrogenase [Bacteroidetes bacterium 4572_117]|nr:MAG: shikimate dehydrogenase [Bacteroidetes bacterium 4572_117]
MTLYGLIGYPLSHSFSQSYFRNKFKNEGYLKHDYLNFSIRSIAEVREIVDKHPKLEGFNVTIPYKELIIKYLDDIDDAAREIAAVNTVKIIRRENKKAYLKGYNTDIYGFEKSLKPFLTTSLHKQALILGNGGASKAVAYVLKKRNIDYKLVSREPISNLSISYNQIDKTIVNSHTLIINTTPLGMFPHINHFPKIPYQYINTNHILFDLVYNPPKTKFLELGEVKGATIINGHKMLIYQAEKAWEIFNYPN